MNVANGRLALPVTSNAAIDTLTCIITHGPIARVEIARQVGLSQAAVTKAVAPLMAAGLVEHVPDPGQPTTPGRPVTPLRVPPGALMSFGVKVTAGEVIAVSLGADGTIDDREHVSLPAHDLEHVLAAVVAAVGALDSRRGPGRHPVVGIGVTVSGDVDAEAGLVRDSSLLGWRDVPLRALLESQLAVPVVIDNDVRAYTVAEHWFGEGLDASSFALVTIGSGIGSGLFVGGEVVAGAYGVAGELGHLPLAPGNLRCVCGMRGCVETVASTDAIVSAVRRITGRRRLTIEKVVEMAHAGEAAAIEAFDRAGTVLGKAIAVLVNLIGPNRVIIGGEAVGQFDLYERRLRRSFAAHAFGAAKRCELVIRPDTFDDWAAGAAVVALRAFVRGDLPNATG